MGSLAVALVLRPGSNGPLRPPRYSRARTCARSGSPGKANALQLRMLPGQGGPVSPQSCEHAASVTSSGHHPLLEEMSSSVFNFQFLFPHKNLD